RVLGAQLEDVPDLDAALDLQRALAVRARVAFDDVADVADFPFRLQVAPVDAGEVEAGLVRAADEVAHFEYGPIADDAHRARQVSRLAGDVGRLHRKIHGADVAWAAADDPLDFLVPGEAEVADQLLQFDLVQRVIAPQQHHPKLIFMGPVVVN